MQGKLRTRRTVVNVKADRAHQMGKCLFIYPGNLGLTALNPNHHFRGDLWRWRFPMGLTRSWINALGLFLIATER